jgi:hypothetical protein
LYSAFVISSRLRACKHKSKGPEKFLVSRQPLSDKGCTETDPKLTQPVFLKSP